MGEDIVKVEVWDVVDVAKKRVKIEGLKTSESGQDLTPRLDAEFLDVYQGTHGVIMVMDITKAWTMDYIRKEADKKNSSFGGLAMNKKDRDKVKLREVVHRQLRALVT